LEQTNLSGLDWMPGLSRIVAFDGIPAHIPDFLIAVIRNGVDRINIARDELVNGLKSGDIIRIQDGPFRGYEASFDELLPGSERIRVLLKLLKDRQIPAELPTGLINPEKQP